MGETESTGPPDRQTLQLLERHLSRRSLVDHTEFVPDSFEPRLLRAGLDRTQFPDEVDSVRLDIRWFTTGDFSVHYVETQADGSRWECRWDRHPNEHNDRLHFHQPPNGHDTVDLSFPSTHPLEVYSTVLDALTQRLANQWVDE